MVRLDLFCVDLFCSFRFRKKYHQKSFSFAIAEPGEFQFKESQYFADLKTGLITAEVVRQKGCDGTVTLEYSTM